MSLRFRKSIKIAPGVKVNINKKSMGVTVGSKRVHVTKNTSGRTTTSVNLPVKGLSYTDIQTKNTVRKNTATSAASVSSAICSAQHSNVVQDKSAVEKGERYKVKVVAVEAPSTSVAVVGGAMLVGGFFLSGYSILLGIVVALLGVYLIYATVNHKRHPDKGNYISEDALAEWRRMVSVDSGNVYELGKVSLPVLIELKKLSLMYLDQFSSAVSSEDKEKFSGLLLDCQQKIVDLSEFVILKGDKPQEDLKKYVAMIEDGKNR